MNKKVFYSIVMAVFVATGFTACSQDELTDDNALPEGKYPLEIANVTLTTDVSEQPWSANAPQTRVSENEDGNSSVWENGDKIVVGIEGDSETGTYIMNVAADNSVSISPEKAVYWKDTTPKKVRGWFPTVGEGLRLDAQTEENGLAYALFAETENVVDYNSANISLPFVHKLAKVRVVLEGSDKDKVYEVKIKTLTSCTLNADGTLTAGSTEDFIPMVNNGNNCWETNVVPGHKITNFRINGTTEGTLDGEGITPESAKVNTITLTVGAKEITGGETVTEPGDYIVTGSVTKTITLNGEGINLTLKDANISVSSGNGIAITGSSPTIRVEGTNTVSSSKDAGIYVAAGSTVTITGNNRDDKLTVTAGKDAAGIGGCSNKQDCGNINISKVTVTAKGSSLVAFSPGIGSTSTAKCGAITIDDATVHAYGTGVTNYCACPGIGTGGDNSGSTGTVLPVITIRNNSEVHAHRGNEYADYIGYAYWQTSGGQVRGTITGSTVYCYTGDSNTPDKTIVYDASGKGTEQ